LKKQSEVSHLKILAKFMHSFYVQHNVTHENENGTGHFLNCGDEISGLQ
jgi:hypothetical protein